MEVQIKRVEINVVGVPASLQTVLDQLASVATLTASRKRDLRSAVITYAKWLEKAPAMISLDLADIRQTFDAMVGARARLSRKRWANLRSDLAAAIDASGLRPMLKTAGIDLDEAWSGLLAIAGDPAIERGLSRFARWASLRRIHPTAVDSAVVERFMMELGQASLIRNIERQHRAVATAWNRLVDFQPEIGLHSVAVPSCTHASARLEWSDLSADFRADVERHLAWCAMPDPLDPQARCSALAPRTLHLRRDHIHSAVTAAANAGLDVTRWKGLPDLVAVETFRSLMRKRWEQGGRSLTAYTHGIAGTLIAIAAETVKASADTIMELKELRRKLGTLPPGLTQKNQALLRKFDDPRLVDMLIDLPDRVWRQARRDLATSRRPFIDLQAALAIDILIHVPLRMENLFELNFEKHLHWPQGRRKPALMVFAPDETKNDIQLEFEIPTELAERLQIYRNEIAPAVTGKRPDAVFVTWAGKPKSQRALTIAIKKAVLSHIGVRLSPHQFRHLAAKIILDANPGAYELVRQLLGQKNLKTTTKFYAGIDTRRAGRAHADLLMKRREARITRHRRPKPSRKKD